MKFGYDRSGSDMDRVSMFFPNGKLSGARSISPDAYLPQTAVDAQSVSPLPAYDMEANGPHLGRLGEWTQDELGIWYDDQTTPNAATPQVTPTGYISQWGQVVYSSTPSTSATPGGSGSQVFGSNTLSEWAKAIGDLYIAGKTADAQGKLIDLNMQRAQMGYSPLPLSMFNPTGAGAIAPATQSMLLFGALGLGAFLLLKPSGK